VFALVVMTSGLMPNLLERDVITASARGGMKPLLVFVKALICSILAAPAELSKRKLVRTPGSVQKR